MTVFDELAETDGDAELPVWLSKLIDAKQDIVAFVAQQIKSDISGEFDSYLKGSFNLSLVVRLGDERKVVVRFPKPGHTTTSFRDEKIRNEAHFLDYLRERTTIPVPRVLSWGLADTSPRQLGPFLIMDYVHGTTLSNLLKQATKADQDEVILANDVDDIKLDYVYEQLADYMLQLSQLDFSTIGAISKDSSDEWKASQRPLTYNMNELASVVSKYPTSGFPSGPFTSAKAFLNYLADEHLVHLRTQRNLSDDREDAEKRFIARHCFKKSIERYCLADAGPFKPYCDDFRPTNVLADPESFRITGILDFEFTNTMPAQFAYDPPWWLLLLGPDMWPERYNMENFTARYVPRMEQFLRAMELVEARKKAETNSCTIPLSTRMRDSWASGRFWLDYGIRESFDIDAVYWAAIHRPGDAVFDEDMRKEMKLFVDMKMERLKAYDDECKVRFSG